MRERVRAADCSTQIPVVQQIAETSVAETGVNDSG
jgi:hypothetical protein